MERGWDYHRAGSGAGGQVNVVSLGQAGGRAPAGQTRSTRPECFAFGQRSPLEDHCHRVRNVETQTFHARRCLGGERRILHKSGE